MIQKTIVSFFDNLKTKTTNPFLGTLIIVWIYRNYENFYVLFFSGSTTEYPVKIAALHGLYKTENFLGSFFVTIAITILVLIGTYALLNLSRLIVNLYNKQLTPWIYKITDESSIVLKKDYDRIAEDRDNYQKRFEDERKERYRVEGELDNSGKRVLELEKQIQDGKDVKNLLPPPQVDSRYDLTSEDRRQFKEILNTLEQGGMTSEFEKILSNVGQGNEIKNTATLVTLARLGLVTQLGNTKYYKLTVKGDKLQYYHFREKERVDNEGLIGDRRIIMNISVDQKDKFFELLSSTEEFEDIKHSHHNNADKKNFFTFTIKNGNDKLFNVFREFLATNGITYDNYK